MYIFAAGWYISVASRMCASARDEVGNVASRMCASAIERYQPTPPHPTPPPPIGQKTQKRTYGKPAASTHIICIHIYIYVHVFGSPRTPVMKAEIHQMNRVNIYRIYL